MKIESLQFSIRSALVAVLFLPAILALVTWLASDPFAFICALPSLFIHTIAGTTCLLVPKLRWVSVASIGLAAVTIATIRISFRGASEFLEAYVITAVIATLVAGFLLSCLIAATIVVHHSLGTWQD